MKFRFLLVSVCLLFVFGSLFSQSVFVKQDSILKYEFSGISDSILSDRTIRIITDSASARANVEYRYQRNTENGNWDFSSKHTLFQNAEGRNMGECTEIWDSIAGKLRVSKGYDNFFDSLGNYTLLQAYMWDIDARDIVPTFSNQYTYDDFGNRTAFFGCNWDMISGEWDCECAFTYENTYDTIQNLKSKITTIWDNENMEYAILNEYDYDSLDRLVLTTEWRKDSAAGVWLINSKEERDYLSGDNFPNTRVFKWDANIEEWWLYLVRNYENDSLGKALSYDYFKRDLPQLEGSWRWYNNAQDPYGNTISWESYHKDAETGYLEPIRKTFVYSIDQLCVQYDTICKEDSVEFGGEFHSFAGMFSQSYVSLLGTDSTSQLQLAVYNDADLPLISGDSYSPEGGSRLYNATADDFQDYQWGVINGSIESYPDPGSVRITWNSPGEGEVFLVTMDKHGCLVDTSKIFVTIGNTALQELNSSGLVFYPVPVQDELQIACNQDEIYWEITSLQGAVLLKSKGKRADLTSLHAGMYLIRVFENDRSVIGCHKIMKR